MSSQPTKNLIKDRPIPAGLSESYLTTYAKYKVARKNGEVWNVDSNQVQVVAVLGSIVSDAPDGGTGSEDDMLVKPASFRVDPNTTISEPTPAVVSITSPAAGAELLYSMGSAGIRQKVYAFRFQLVTDANAATRRVNLVLDDATNPAWQLPFSQTQTAGLTYNYYVGPWPTVAVVANAVVTPANIVRETWGPVPYWNINAVWRIRTLTDNIQIGDQYSAIFIYRGHGAGSAT